MDNPDRTSPEATLAAFRRTMMAGEWGRALSLLSPRAREGLVGGAYAGAAWMDGHDEASRRSLAALMEGHGLGEKGTDRTWSTEERARMLSDLDGWSRESLPSLPRLDLAGHAAATIWSGCRVSGHRAYAITTCGGRRPAGRPNSIRCEWADVRAPCLSSATTASGPCPAFNAGDGRPW